MTSRFDPPPGYDDERKQIWADVVEQLTTGGRIFTASRDALDAYVQSVRSLRRASTLLAQTDVLVIRDGKASANPALAVQRQSAESVARIAKQLGLNRPAANPISLPPGSVTHEPTPAPEPLGRYCDRHRRRECVKHKRGGELCHASPVRGTAVCRKHGGKSLEELKADGARNLARTYGQPRDITAGQGLMEEIRRTAGAVAWLEAEVADIPPEDLFYGTTRVVNRADGPEVTQEAKPHAKLAAYWREREHLASICSAALARGAEQEMIDAARAAGMGAARVLDEVFSKLNLSPEQLALIPVIVPAAFRRLNVIEAAAGQ